MRVAVAIAWMGLLVASAPAQNAPPRQAPPQGPPQAAPRQATPTRPVGPAPAPAVRPAAPPATQMQGGQPAGAPQTARAPIGPPTAPMAPFVLTPAEEAEVQQALVAWEAACAQISDVKCSFHRIDENRTFNKREEFDGEIKYKRPDKARYWAKGKESQEQFFCDGLSLYQWDYEQKLIINHVLPEDMRGAAIADGPLPFLFTATADKLRNRYFLRIVTPADQRETSIWIEAHPRHQRDAANFSKATVILDKQNMLPSHVQTFDTNGIDRKVHAFTDFKLNDALIWLKGDFNKPWGMPGWKSIVDDPQAEAAAHAAQNPAPAKR